MGANTEIVPDPDDSKRFIVHSQIWLDGAQISSAVQTQTLRRARRNTAAGLRTCAMCRTCRSNPLAGGLRSCPWCDSP